MKIEKKCGEFGTLSFRKPNIPEAMKLLGKMGVNSKSVSDFENNELLYLANLIEQLEPFITDINLNINGNNITTFKGVLDEFVMMPFLSEIATELFSTLNWTEQKKM